MGYELSIYFPLSWPFDGVLFLVEMAGFTGEDLDRKQGSWERAVLEEPWALG